MDQLIGAFLGDFFGLGLFINNSLELFNLLSLKHLALANAYLSLCYNNQRLLCISYHHEAFSFIYKDLRSLGKTFIHEIKPTALGFLISKEFLNFRENQKRRLFFLAVARHFIRKCLKEGNYLLFIQVKEFHEILRI